MDIQYELQNTLISFIIFLLFGFNPYSEEFEVQSPNKVAKFKINIGETISYSVFFKGNPILINSSFSLEFAQGAVFEKDFIVEQKVQREMDETWKPLFGKHAVIRNHCNELTLVVREKKFPGRLLELTYRAYDDGVAFRYSIPLPSTRPTLNLKHEKTQFAFQKNHTVWMADHNVFDSPQEREFRKAKLSDITEINIIGLPLLVQLGNYGYAAITEANLTGWGALYLTSSRDGGNILTSTLATIPGSDAEEGHKLLAARLKLPAVSPWRVILLRDKPAKLLESELLMNLNEPCKLENTSWIQPEKCARDAWWTGTKELKDNASNKRFIDFSSSMGSMD
jgi:alpha-glucosidase